MHKFDKNRDGAVDWTEFMDFVNNSGRSSGSGSASGSGSGSGVDTRAFSGVVLMEPPVLMPAKPSGPDSAGQATLCMVLIEWIACQCGCRRSHLAAVFRNVSLLWLKGKFEEVFFQDIITLMNLKKKALEVIT